MGQFNNLVKYKFPIITCIQHKFNLCNKMLQQVHNPYKLKLNKGRYGNEETNNTKGSETTGKS